MAKINYHVTIDEIFSPLKKAKAGAQIKPSKGKKSGSSWFHADNGDQLDPDGNKINKRASLPGLQDVGASFPGNIPDEARNTLGIQHNPGVNSVDDETRSGGVPQPNKGKNPWGTVANDFLVGAAAVDALIPYGRIKKQQIVRPPHAYNQYPYGTGSQAIMDNGGSVPYNPPFNNAIAHQVAEDKAGAPRHYYHSDDDYYAQGGPVPQSNVITVDQNNIPTITHGRNNSSRYTPNGPVYNMVPYKGPFNGNLTKDDSANYLNDYNKIKADPSGSLMNYNNLNRYNYGIELTGSGYNFLNAYEDANTPGTMTLTLPPDTKPPKKKANNGGQYGGYQEPIPSAFVNKDNSANVKVFDNGGELSKDQKDNVLTFKKGGKVKAKYGYRVHQDETRNRPTFEDGGEVDNKLVWEDGGYISKLNSKGKVIPNILAKGGGISPNQARSDRPYNQMTYYDKDIVARAGSKISPEQAKEDYPYTQMSYENGGGIHPYTYGKDEDLNKLVFAAGGVASMPGATGFMAARVAGTPSDSPLRKKKIQNKAEAGGRMIAGGLGGPGKTYKKGKYEDSFDDNMLLTAEYDNGGSVEPDFVPRNYKNKAQKGQKKARPIMPIGGVLSGGPDKPFNNKNLIASSNSGIMDAQFEDTLNGVLSSGNRPNAGSRPRGGYTPEQNNLINSAYVWKQSHVGASPEQTMEGFYNTPADPNNPTDHYRKKLSIMGYGPTAMYHTSPNVDLQQRQGNNIDDPTKPKMNSVASTASIKQFDNGGSVNESRIIPQPLKFHYGGDAEAISNNPYAGPTVQFNGPSHEEGGIGMSYGGKKVEVEGGETGVVDKDGDFNVMGNMMFPGTSTKFKALSKKIASQENSANRKFDKGSKLMDDASPDDSYDYLRFNSGRALTIGADMRMKKLASAREQLGDIQKTILDTADRMNVDPQELSQGKYKAKMGARINYADGGELGGPGDDKKLSRSDRNHNPGNIKYGTWAKAHGATGQDKDGFATFDDDNVGLGAMTSLLQSKGYNNLSVKDAITKWTAGKPYNYDLGPLSSKRVGDLSSDEFDKVVGTMRTGEGTRYGVPSTVNVPRAQIPVNPATPPAITYNPNTPTPDRFQGHYLQNQPDDNPLPDLPGESGDRIPSSTQYNKLGISEVAGEIYSAATNRQIPVPAQKFTPQLLQPYSVSFQDRINENNDTFTSMAKQLDYNPSALAALGAQKYSADNAVKGEEFRTNQAISQDIANKNVGILNEAQQENLKLADTQMVRQATARAKTKAQTQEALNSVSSKILQNNLENRRMQLYEPLFDYRLTDTDGNGEADSFTYQGGAANFDFSGIHALQGRGGPNDPNGRLTTVRDSNGNVKYTRESDRPQTDSELKGIELYQKRRQMYLPPR